MKKHIALFLFLSAILAAPAQAETMPSELMGTWSVTMSKTAAPESKTPSGWCQTYYIFKPDSKQGLAFNSYNDCVFGGITQNKFTVTSLTYTNGRLKLVTSDPDSRGVNWAFETQITFAKGTQPFTGKGKFKELKSPATATYGKKNISAVLDLKKTSDATDIPVREPKQYNAMPATQASEYYDRQIPSARNIHALAVPTMSHDYFLPGSYLMQGQRLLPPDSAECPARRSECLQRCNVPNFGEENTPAEQAACKSKCSDIFDCAKH